MAGKKDRKKDKQRKAQADGAAGAGVAAAATGKIVNVKKQPVKAKDKKK